MSDELQRTYLSGDRAVLISLTVKVKVHLACLSVCILICTAITLWTLVTEETFLTCFFLMASNCSTCICKKSTETHTCIHVREKALLYCFIMFTFSCLSRVCYPWIYSTWHFIKSWGQQVSVMFLFSSLPTVIVPCEELKPFFKPSHSHTFVLQLQSVCCFEILYTGRQAWHQRSGYTKQVVGLFELDRTPAEQGYHTVCQPRLAHVHWAP